LSDHDRANGDRDLWDGRWVDHRWGDPQTRAQVDQQYAAQHYATVEDTASWTGGGEPVATSRPPHRLIPVLAGLIGLALGAAIGVPVGLAHRPDAPPPTAAVAPANPGSGGSGSSLSPSDVATKVDQSIVDITSRISYQNATAAGTGMVLTADGEVLTNNHVIEGATSITATSVTTGRQYRVTVLGTDPTEDVALLKLSDASGLTPITVGASAKVGVGDPVVALGNAGGVGGTPAIASGYVTALDQSITASDASGRNPQRLTGLIETDAPIRPGDSGGPLSNMTAQVIGMDSAASVNTFGTADNRGYAIPIQHALDIAHQIEAGQGSSTVHIGTRGMIGVQVSALSTGGGAMVESVTAGSPADRAGIHAGDTITGVDGHAVTTADSLGTLIKAHAAGEHVTVTWTSSDGSTHTARMTLVAGPPD
jgi:S1-C subfamily serine protease